MKHKTRAFGLSDSIGPAAKGDAHIKVLGGMNAAMRTLLMTEFLALKLKD